MNRVKSKWAIILVALASVVAVTVTPGAALPDYVAKTGQTCGTCHVNPAGGGPLTAKGQAFAAIATHATDPAGAWAQVSGAPAPTPAPPTAPAPGPSGILSVSISGASTDDSVAYSIMVRNTSDKPVANVYIAGSIPVGAEFMAATTTPAGSGFYSSEGGSAAWLAPVVPAKGTMGPFVYKVAKGTARDLSALGFVHWLSPSDGTDVSAKVAPISNAERLALEQAINDKFSSYSADLPLWRIQSGTAPRMIELTDHFNLMWFAAQAGNWVFADFEVYRSDEALKAIEVTRPARAAGLRAWWQPAQTELEEAVKAQDLAAFTKAYDRAIAGCNSCHAASTGGGISLKGVKVIRPTTPLFSNLDYSGNK